jgi:hypothetical protein
LNQSQQDRMIAQSATLICSLADLCRRYRARHHDRDEAPSSRDLRSSPEPSANVAIQERESVIPYQYGRARVRARVTPGRNLGRRNRPIRLSVRASPGQESGGENADRRGHQE